ncbi:phosphoribosylglycinamide formyltransferase [Flavobacterium sp. '19STA2R22 D10 B1']|uniref:phosphoribosylglycinamide formyltransferase n=1 Tax=Flavobacterium aerium TaxID=3037261 RepID=UPI00278BF819|nr:phosphoribosylglycinamide formyltransferase [Flavobacterium sp. '19STA2R22 D10 B1']
MKSVIIFASGAGSNAENIILECNKSEVARVTAVFSNNPNAGVIEKAKKYKVPVLVVSKEAISEETILSQLAFFQPDLIVLAGFLLKFPKHIIDAYPNKVINIHPALLPNYGGKGMYGMNVHRAVVENKEKETGITIHYVNEHYDEGNIIFQEKVTLQENDTPETVAGKIHDLEQKFFPEVIMKLIQ